MLHIDLQKIVRSYLHDWENEIIDNRITKNYFNEVCSAGWIHVLPIFEDTFDIARGFKNATSIGALDCLEYILHNFTQNLKWHSEIFLNAAVKSGSLECVLFIQKNFEITNFNSALNKAIRYRHNHLVKYFLSIGTKNYNLHLMTAVNFGNLGAIILLLKLGATNLNYPLNNAAAFGSMLAVKILHKAGAQVSIQCPAICDLRILVWLCANGASKFTDALAEAKYYNIPYLITLFGYL